MSMAAKEKINNKIIEQALQFHYLGLDLLTDDILRYYWSKKTTVIAEALKYINWRNKHLKINYKKKNK